MIRDPQQLVVVHQLRRHVLEEADDAVLDLADELVGHIGQLLFFRRKNDFFLVVRESALPVQSIAKFCNFGSKLCSNSQIFAAIYCLNK